MTDPERSQTQSLIEAFRLLRDIAGDAGSATVSWTDENGSHSSLWVSGPNFEPDEDEADDE
ncbi:hypothetical protein GCM10009809_42050 [Isoptericola hypogeus]|uniref:Uncharacterized protein n=1 Tax=Isoptericola hypogeus TaxID=300179 RepID=A0ABP4W058_9MICO